MEKYFVTYEQALALKELGFNKKCFNLFDKNGSLMYKPNGNIVMIKIDNHNKTNFCSAPLKSQVFEWFREKYNYIFQIHYLYNGNYQLVIHKNTHEYVKICESYQRSYSCVDEEPDNYSYEEAESNCVDKLIELVKNLKK